MKLRIAFSESLKHYRSLGHTRLPCPGIGTWGQDGLRDLRCIAFLLTVNSLAILTVTPCDELGQQNEWNPISVLHTYLSPPSIFLSTSWTSLLEKVFLFALSTNGNATLLPRNFQQNLLTGHLWNEERQCWHVWDLMVSMHEFRLSPGPEHRGVQPDVTALRGLEPSRPAAPPGIATCRLLVSCELH